MAQSNEFMAGWAQGWMAASKAMTDALRQVPAAPAAAVDLAMAGNAPRRRGRPPKSATIAGTPPVKRPRGRPRKTEQTA